MHRIDRVGTKRLLVVLFQDALAGRLKVGFHLVPDGSCLAELEYGAAKLNASKSAPLLAARPSRTICATWSLFPWPSKIRTIRPPPAPSPAWAPGASNPRIHERAKADAAMAKSISFAIPTANARRKHHTTHSHKVPASP